MKDLNFSIDGKDPFFPEVLTGLTIEKNCIHKDTILSTVKEYKEADDNDNDLLNDYRILAYPDGKVEVLIFSQPLLDRINLLQSELQSFNK